MSQIRKDMLTGDWVIFAENRLNKPYHFKRKHIAKATGEKDCPFCAGNECLTPQEILRCGDESCWEIRVFKNMYPAVEETQEDDLNELFYESRLGIGIHEVVVDTPNHHQDISEFSLAHMKKVMETLQERFIMLEKEEFIEYVQIFKNNGADAGASIAHSHWQIMGVSYIPNEQEKILKSMSAYEEKNGGCLVCEMAKEEKRVNKRIVYENDKFLAFVPYAAKFAYEILVVPKEHVKSIKDFDDSLMEGLGDVLINILGRIKKIREGIGFNLCIQDIPKKYRDKSFHWYLRILPRIGAPAGFEYSTGSYINPIKPEESAKFINTLNL